MSSFTDFIRLQNDIAQALLSDTELATINLVTRERLIADESKLPDKTLALEVLVYITPRAGRRGCGIILEKPEVVVENPNLPGPEMFLQLTALILEEPLANYAPSTGTLKPADQVGQRILEDLHGLQIEGLGQLFADRNALTAAVDFEPLRGYRVNFRCRIPRTQSDRPVYPTITEDAGTITLTHPLTDAEIRYTTDGSYPGVNNPVAQLYAGPFAADTGTIIRAAAYVVGAPPGHALKATIT